MTSGRVAPDAFLVGYGLDYRGRYRNLDALWAIDGEALAADPDLHVATLYGSAQDVTHPGDWPTASIERR